jgi:DnaK suppressor protein
LPLSGKPGTDPGYLPNGPRAIVRYLTIEQRESLQRKLRDRASSLRDEIAAALRDDEAVADLESSIDVAQLERDVRELREVEAALGRLHAPDYGICADCGAEISYSRLIVNPSATRCISCQTKAEHFRTGQRAG